MLYNAAGMAMMPLTARARVLRDVLQRERRIPLARHERPLEVESTWKYRAANSDSLKI